MHLHIVDLRVAGPTHGHLAYKNLPLDDVLLVRPGAATATTTAMGAAKGVTAMATRVATGVETGDGCRSETNCSSRR